MRCVYVAAAIALCPASAWAADWAQICNDPVQKILYQSECLHYELTGDGFTASEPRRDGDGLDARSADHPDSRDFDWSEERCAGTTRFCGNDARGAQEPNVPSGIKAKSVPELHRLRDDIYVYILRAEEDRETAWYYNDYDMIEQIDYSLERAHADLRAVDTWLNYLRHR